MQFDRIKGTFIYQKVTVKGKLIAVNVSIAQTIQKPQYKTLMPADVTFLS